MPLYGYHLTKAKILQSALLYDELAAVLREAHAELMASDPRRAGVELAAARIAGELALKGSVDPVQFMCEVKRHA